MHAHHHVKALTAAERKQALEAAREVDADVALTPADNPTQMVRSALNALLSGAQGRSRTLIL